MQTYRHRDTVKICTISALHDPEIDTVCIPMQDVPETITQLSQLYREYAVAILLRGISEHVNSARTLEILTDTLRTCSVAQLQDMMHDLNTDVGHGERIEEGTLMHSVLSGRRHGAKHITPL